MEGLFVGQNESSDGRFVCRTERVQRWKVCL